MFSRRKLFARLNTGGPVYMSPPPEDDKGGGGGGGGSDKPKPEELVASLTVKYGDAQRALGVVAADNHELREWKRRAKENPTSLLPEGSVVLTKEQATVWTSFSALGKTPDQLKASMENEGKLQGQLDQMALEKVHATAATTLKWKPTVLSDIATTKGLEIIMKDETVDGKVVPKAFARPAADKNAPLQPLEEYITKNHSDYLPALKVDPENTGTKWPNQQGTGESTPKGSSATVDRYLAQNKKQAEAANPLRPVKTT